MRPDLLVLALIAAASAAGIYRLLQQVSLARAQGAPLSIAFLAYSSTAAFAGALLWVLSAKVGSLAVLFWGGMALAFGSAIAYLVMYSATGGGPTPAVARANGVSERTRAAAMVGLVGASASMVCLRMQWWLPLIPGLVLTIVGWAATIVFWLKDS